MQKQMEHTMKAARPKMITTVATKSKMVAMKATKPMSEVLKEAWKAKNRVVAQGKKKFKMTKIVSNVAFSTMVICYFKERLSKRSLKKLIKDKPLTTPKINEDFSGDWSREYKV